MWYILESALVIAWLWAAVSTGLAAKISFRHKYKLYVFHFVGYLHTLLGIGCIYMSILRAKWALSNQWSFAGQQWGAHWMLAQLLITTTIVVLCNMLTQLYSKQVVAQLIQHQFKTDASIRYQLAGIALLVAMSMEALKWIF